MNGLNAGRTPVKESNSSPAEEDEENADDPLADLDDEPGAVLPRPCTYNSLMLRSISGTALRIF
jgi:hypothetical protein